MHPNSTSSPGATIAAELKSNTPFRGRGGRRSASQRRPNVSAAAFELWSASVCNAVRAATSPMMGSQTTDGVTLLCRLRSAEGA